MILTTSGITSKKYLKKFFFFLFFFFFFFLFLFLFLFFLFLFFLFFKPEDFNNSTISDFFEFEYDSLPHKILEEDSFNSKLKVLSDKFNNENNPNFIWKNHFKSDIPSDGFPTFAGQIWDVIKSNRDLDLPTQREALATFRCEDISDELLNSFQESIAPHSEQLKKHNIVDNFGSLMGTILQKTLGTILKIYIYNFFFFLFSLFFIYFLFFLLFIFYLFSFFFLFFLFKKN